MNSMYHCQWCGKTFHSTRKDALYCSASCRTMMSREKQKLKHMRIQIETQVRRIANRLKRSELNAIARDQLEQIARLLSDLLKL